jgi:sigma-B regulation protein RsbU (phosphoserine phosphatase)
MSNGMLERLTRTAVALGVMEQPSIHEQVLSLEHGDTLLLYTDGLTEAFSPDGDLFGETRLVNVLMSLRATSADEVIRAVEDCLNNFVDTNPLADDLTMLAIRMNG